MKKIKIATALLYSVFFSSSALAEKEKITLLLDWFVNPVHATMVVAQQKGFFAEQGLEVEMVEPADPSAPPKLVAAGQADISMDYQPNLYMQIDEGLPLVRIATLVSTPLNSLVVLEDSHIQQLSDLKGKKIGYSVSGFESALLGTMLKSSGVSTDEVEMVNVNWSLSPALITKKVDAVIGAYRCFELNQLNLEHHKGKAFFPEEHGVPAYEELILVVNKNRVNERKFSKFLTALENAANYIKTNPEAAWLDFMSYKPKDLDNELNRLAWRDTVPALTTQVRALDRAKYQQMAEFMSENKLIKQIPLIDDYAVELKSE
ncbi:putative hydroxymethylpyrimidine transport system substrate-binding protein [Cricetibacter osteomyelitidis]|uniref:Putative hydroxymethylpyrimidine transport system substrate-binding protein n=1 Tax=Cricetibacter osteomyelitidis TaxID=1521931 RepID=A0A4R2T5U5_9PAST|nr:ABC transporter substrate-binding protein [Cricetibacter osteomyelitidis]TCP96224.1 putative hydroxymethylpyrimidine transport system substrate-binding protein [Cricetibacter osteomyelitidis]